MELLCFRIVIVSGFLAAAWRWGDWRNWQRYYPTILFVMVINMSAGYISYHHSLWNYSKDILVTTETIVEFINTYVNLPATVFIYLSQFPSGKNTQKLLYGSYWVLLYGFLEFIDHYVFGGLFYTNNWAWTHSVLFDVAMFSIIRAHHLHPLRGWLLTFALGIFIIFKFGFITGEMK